MNTERKIRVLRSSLNTIFLEAKEPIIRAVAKSALDETVDIPVYPRVLFIVKNIIRLLWKMKAARNVNLKNLNTMNTDNRYYWNLETIKEVTSQESRTFDLIPKSRLDPSYLSNVYDNIQVSPELKALLGTTPREVKIDVDFRLQYEVCNRGKWQLNVSEMEYGQYREESRHITAIPVAPVEVVEEGDKRFKKIYVASSWRNAFQPVVVYILRELGHEVYDFRNPKEGDKGFAWSDIDEDWLNWTPDAYVRAMSHPIAEDGFKSDFDAMKWADCCVMVLPCGRSANTEAGWMKGAGKDVYVYQPTKQEPELMYKIHDGIITSEEELVNLFKINTHAKQ